ncbi:MAG TPA: RelA/SpoT domain-containing protein [Cyclobacteriaceae bacterium]|nr:RelA/SpoT domain-containing protein [Cyclobacteriaceae bacterium]
MYQARNIQRLAKEISELIQDDLSRVGIFYRIFHRCKEETSVTKKILSKGYDGETKFLRDVIGVRINLYFIDDLQIVFDHLQMKYKNDFVEMTIDKKNATEFKPTRINLIYRIPKKYLKEFTDLVTEKEIDKTYEIQLRTILSEGWHEVDHDMRYKCPDDWVSHSDLSRYFNGILASLETSDLSILNLFDQISYRHYKAGNWKAMLRTKLRLRMTESEQIQKLDLSISGSNEIQKQLFKFDRKDFLKRLLSENYKFPFSYSNLIYVINSFYLNYDEINQLSPKDIGSAFKA